MPKLNEPLLVAFMGPWTEEQAQAVLHFASDLTGEPVEDFVSIGAVLDPDPDVLETQQEQEREQETLHAFHE